MIFCVEADWSYFFIYFFFFLKRTSFSIPKGLLEFLHISYNYESEKRGCCCCSIIVWRRRKQTGQRVHPINTSREKFGEFYTLVKDLTDFPDHFYISFHMDVEQCQNLLQVVEEDISKIDTISIHMDVEQCQKLLQLVEEDISKIDTNYHHCITNEEKLSFCLRHIYCFYLISIHNKGSLLIHLAKCLLLGHTVILLVWMPHKLVSSNSAIKYVTNASCKSFITFPCHFKYPMYLSVISFTRQQKNIIKYNHVV